MISRIRIRIRVRITVMWIYNTGLLKAELLNKAGEQEEGIQRINWKEENGE
jgi:hypothetical protein